jgi:predicted Zn finger-like uncharacterized protein
MRLVCPNCSAQYEVDSSLLPDDGTEVQCSACSHVWFQTGPQGSQAPASPAPPRPAPEATAPPAEKAASARTAPTTPPPTAHTPSEVDEEVGVAAGPATPPPARELDPAVADVLRAEAEFEARQRAKDNPPFETQEELGLLGPATNDSAGAQGRAGAASLPDIDDISSTLEPVGFERAGHSELPQTESARKRSFLSGLAIPVILSCILAGIYLLSPELEQLLPSFQGPLAAYVGFVDTARATVAELLGIAPSAP